MSYVRDSSLDTLSPFERAILEYCAEGLNDHEIANRLRANLGDVSVIRRQAATKLATRIASAHPFQIHEVVLSRFPDSLEF
jgi:DNA-binding NarL/FixJ family response regulator